MEEDLRESFDRAGVTACIIHLRLAHHHAGHGGDGAAGPVPAQALGVLAGAHAGDFLRAAGGHGAVGSALHPHVRGAGRGAGDGEDRRTRSRAWRWPFCCCCSGQPLYLDDAGFVLSFSACAGMLCLTPALTSLLRVDRLRVPEQSLRPSALLLRAGALFRFAAVRDAGRAALHAARRDRLLRAVAPAGDAGQPCHCADHPRGHVSGGGGAAAVAIVDAVGRVHRRPGRCDAPGLDASHAPVRRPAAQRPCPARSSPLADAPVRRRGGRRLAADAAVQRRALRAAGRAASARFAWRRCCPGRRACRSPFSTRDRRTRRWYWRKAAPIWWMWGWRAARSATIWRTSALRRRRCFSPTRTPTTPAGWSRCWKNTCRRRSTSPQAGTTWRPTRT